MSTFSQVVDSLVTEVGRPDMRVDIATYLNQTLRELHTNPATGGAALFHDNLREVRLTADVETGFGWDIPNPGTFQKLEAVKYESIFAHDEKTRYAKEMIPGPAMAEEEHFYYRGSQRFVFAGYGGPGATIALAWYEYTARLVYYPVATRPATFDDVLGWVYSDDFNGTPELQAAARALTSNWLLLRWVDLVMEGVRAKVYKRVADEVRQRTSYGLYSQLRQQIYTAETASVF